MDHASATSAPRTHFSAGKRPAIAVRGQCKHFGGPDLYDNFNLDFPQGGSISIFGPNGCGRSTLINLMAGRVPLDGGEIHLRWQAGERRDHRRRVPARPRRFFSPG